MVGNAVPGYGFDRRDAGLRAVDRDGPVRRRIVYGADDSPVECQFHSSNALAIGKRNSRDGNQTGIVVGCATHDQACG